MRWMIVVLLLAVQLASSEENKLSAAEVSQGWKLLFDGSSLKGWMWTTSAQHVVPSWKAAQGLLQTTPGNGTEVYLLTQDSFSDFELSFEWRAEPGANSGIKYRFQGYWVDGQLRDKPGGTKRIEPVGLEYQIIDDERHPDARGNKKHATAAVYEYWPASTTEPVKMGEWHRSRIVARGFQIEHWLDEQKVVDIRIDSPEVQQSFQSSRRRGSSPVLAKHSRRDSPVALQFHDGAVWFRNLKIRRL